jgi:hypothetical protein
MVPLDPPVRVFHPHKQSLRSEVRSIYLINKGSKRLSLQSQGMLVNNSSFMHKCKCVQCRPKLKSKLKLYKLKPRPHRPKSKLRLKPKPKLPRLR